MRSGPDELFDDVTWRVGPGDRIGLVGVNGSGKTTLLRMLAGLRGVDSGVVKVGKTVRIGYLSQDVAELDPTLRVLEAVEAVRRQTVLGDGRELTASALLERFGFTGERQWTPVGDLSGGEKRRLQLLRLLMDEPNVLLLDEPTNDLDVDTLTALEDLLDSWAGTLIAASHDRYFLERVCDTVTALIGAGKLASLPGGVDEYLARRSRERGAANGPRCSRAAAPRLRRVARATCVRRARTSRASSGSCRSSRTARRSCTTAAGRGSDRLRGGRRARRRVARAASHPRPTRRRLARRRPPRRPLVDLRLEVGEQFLHDGVELVGLSRAQSLPRARFGRGEVRSDQVDLLPAADGEPHQHAPTIGGVGLAGHVAAPAEPVDAVGHRARGNLRLVHQRAG